MTAADISVPLSATEAAELADYEVVIRAGLTGFVEVGNALSAIRDRHLYRQTHTTFERYAKDMWGLSRSYAYEVMAAADTVEALSGIPDTPIPANIGQATALAGLTPEVASAVMSSAVDQSGQTTAAKIEATRTRLTAPAAPPVCSPARRRPPFPDAFETAMHQLKVAAERVERLARDDRFPAYIVDDQFAPQSDLDVAERVTFDIGYVRMAARSGKFEFDPKTGRWLNENDEPVDVFEGGTKPAKAPALTGILIETGRRTAWISGPQRVIRPAAETAGIRLMYDQGRTALTMPVGRVSDLLAALQMRHIEPEVRAVDR